MSQLLETTQRLLRETDKSFDEVAEATGLSRRWIYSLAKDSDEEEQQNFGILSVQKVHDYLVEQASTEALRRSNPA